MANAQYFAEQEGALALLVGFVDSEKASIPIIDGALSCLWNLASTGSPSQRKRVSPFAHDTTRHTTRAAHNAHVPHNAQWSSPGLRVAMARSRW